MYNAYEELLAYSDLEDAVDKVYRAYLDARLVDLASAITNDIKEYWQGVAELRRAELDPRTREEYPLTDVLGSTNVPDTAPLGDRPEFVYWFDVRAEFWSQKQAEAQQLKELLLSDAFTHLQKEAAVLHERLNGLERSGSATSSAVVSRPVAYGSSSAVASPPQGPVSRLERVLKSLLAEQPADGEPVRRAAKRKRARS